MTREHAPRDPPTDIYDGAYRHTAGDRTRLLTVQGAAGALGVSPTTIRRWVKEGTVASERVSRPQGYVVEVSYPATYLGTYRRGTCRGDGRVLGEAPGAAGRQARRAS